MKIESRGEGRRQREGDSERYPKHPRWFRPWICKKRKAIAYSASAAAKRIHMSLIKCKAGCFVTRLVYVKTSHLYVACIIISICLKCSKIKDILILTGATDLSTLMKPR